MFAFVMLKESGIGWEFAVAPLASDQRIFTLLVLNTAALVIASAFGELLSRLYTLKHKVLRRRMRGITNPTPCRDEGVNLQKRQARG